VKTGFLLAVLAVAATAETITQPPALLRIVQTRGMRPAVETPAASPGAGIFVFGMTSLTGQSETWLMETHSSFAGLEEFDSGIPRSSRSRNSGDEGSQSLIAFYRHWWSHRPEEAVQALRKVRYFQVSLYRTGLGSEQEFAELLRARKASLDSINLDRPDLVYQVISGAPSGTYLVISPLASLRAIDEGVSRSAAAYLRSTGSPSARAGTSPRAGSELSHENLLFRVEPRFSVVSAEIAEADPGFWKGAP